MTDFKDLEVFVVVEEQGNFSKAALVLNMSQAAVSQRIQKLESSLGCTLLLRGPERRHDVRPVVTTQMGNVVLHFAKQLILIRDQMTEAVNGLSVRGTVRLGVSETIVFTMLQKLLASVSEAYPQIVLEIDVNISPVLLDDLLRKTVDLAILVGPVEHQDLSSSELCSFEMAFVASKEMPFPDGPIELDQIVTRPLITFARNTTPYQNLQKTLKDAGLDATIHVSASLEAVVGMALDGRAIAFIPPAVIENRPHVLEKLRPLNTRIKPEPLRFDLAWPDTLFHTAARRVARLAISVADEMRRSGSVISPTTEADHK